MEYGLIGEKLGHSFSAEVHSKIADYKFELHEVPAEKIDEFMSAKNFCGINVTIPYKQTVIPYLDFVDENALKIGAVNTVVNKSGKLYGYNTDFGGLLALINRKFDNLTGKKVLILGGGATAKTARAVLEYLNAAEILTVSRTPKNNQISYSDAVTVHKNASVIINATPVGMHPNIDNTPISLKEFSNLELVVDVIYNPLRTKLLIEAESLGITAFSGLYMLVAQAVLAAEYFTENHFSTDVIDDIYNQLKNKKENIVLIGMPASGKTTIGKILSEKTGKKFIDTDELIVNKTGKQITDIFNEVGEVGFRKIEREVIKEISTETLSVIATGGGAILDFDNLISLMHNGKIVFLDRPLSELLPTFDRPLANSKEQIIKRYNERIDLYNSASELTVNVTNPEETAKKILNSI